MKFRSSTGWGKVQIYIEKPFRRKQNEKKAGRKSTDPDESVPFVGGQVERAVVVVVDQLHLVVETHLPWWSWWKCLPVLRISLLQVILKGLHTYIFSKLFVFLFVSTQPTCWAMCSSRSTQNPSKRWFPVGAGSSAATWVWLIVVHIGQPVIRATIWNSISRLPWS